MTMYFFKNGNAMYQVCLVYGKVDLENKNDAFLPFILVIRF